jgi:hypothetical protein
LQARLSRKGLAARGAAVSHKTLRGSGGRTRLLRMEASEIVELHKEADFDEYMSRGVIIVIHDEANAAGWKRVAHLQTDRKACSHVDAADFREKVLENAQRNGR